MTRDETSLESGSGGSVSLWVDSRGIRSRCPRRSRRVSEGERPLRRPPFLRPCHGVLVLTPFPYQGLRRRFVRSVPSTGTVHLNYHSMRSRRLHPLPRGVPTMYSGRGRRGRLSPDLMSSGTKKVGTIFFKEWGGRGTENLMRRAVSGHSESVTSLSSTVSDETRGPSFFEYSVVGTETPRGLNYSSTSSFLYNVRYILHDTIFVDLVEWLESSGPPTPPNGLPCRNVRPVTGSRFCLSSVPFVSASLKPVQITEETLESKE